MPQISIARPGQYSPLWAGGASRAAPVSRLNSRQLPFRAAQQTIEDATRGFVHVIDPDPVSTEIIDWLARADLEARRYESVADFLETSLKGSVGCILVDADMLFASDMVAHIALPIVVIAARADVSLAVKAMKAGALDCLQKPMREAEIVAALYAALAVAQAQKCAALREDAVRSLFASLSGRERQVMAFVTAGKLNKQVAGDLGLSEVTIKAHRGAVMRKMEARSFAELVRMADIVADDLIAARDLGAVRAHPQVA